jgi:riboflavin kinase / FMN adenylyltransferase
MQFWSNLDAVPTEGAGTVVTVGKFDGIHLGHQALLNSAVNAARSAGQIAVCVTFDRHPDALLAPERLKPALIGPTQKAELVAESGVDAMLELAFDEELAHLTPREFVEKILVKGLRAKHLVVGDDFRFGVKGAGTSETLAELGQEYGFTVETIVPVLVDGQRVSTSLIRQLLDTGDVSTAARLLGRPHTTRGLVEHGLKLGRRLGFPTANIARDAEGFLPVDGIYAGWLYSNNERYPAALSIGINETIQAVPRVLEAHVLDRDDLDLYDQIVTVEYVTFLRPPAKFSGMEELIAAIGSDCNAIREILERD